MTPPVGAVRSGVVGSGAADALPDSVLYQFLIDDLDANDGDSLSTWPEAEQSDDMALNNGPLYRTDTFGSGYDSVESDGVDDYGETSTMGSFGSNMDTDFAVSLGFSTTDNGIFFGTFNNADSTRLFVSANGFAGSSADTLTVALRDGAGDLIAAETSFNVTDGGDYVFVVNKTANSASGLEIYDAADNNVSTSVNNGSFSSPTDFEFPMMYFARNDRGSPSDYIAANHASIRWFGDSLSQSERQNVFDEYGWYTA